MTKGERIKARRRELGMTQTDLALALGTTKQNIYKYETGVITNIPSDKIEAMAKALQTTPAYIMGWNEEQGNLPANVLPMPTMRKIPLLGTIACGVPILAVEQCAEFVDLPNLVHADFALRCKGDSMINARIFDGDMVYIQRQPMVDNGEIAAVVIGDEATLKRVYYTPGSDRITLRACNPMYPDMEYSGASLESIQILGKAVAFTGMIRL